MSTSSSDKIDLTGKISKWFQNRFTSLYEAVTPPPEEEYNMTELVYSAFGKDAEIFYNHKKVDLTKFQEELEAGNFGVAGSTIEWKELMEMPLKETDPDSEPTEVSIVAGVFVVTRAMKYLIRASPAIRLHYNTFSAKVEQDDAAQPDANGNRHRITQLFFTSVHKAAPIHMQTIPGLVF
ncbi:hypothetical protein CPB84DRAFT_1846340 [Gymnopilus junonius]|uniref:Uncharacterized protein n=1 Tax=Gymnopilus junonius TaxID=109634 RepID=A0A9P5NRC3_GYMJU|nr:hypothetical protein CPB84DRAFT_1846340 [Gymnopilus junonius]